MKQNKNANSSVFEASVGSVSPTELASAVNTKLDEKINNGTIASGSQVASLSSQLDEIDSKISKISNFEGSYEIWYPTDFPKPPFKIYKDVDNVYKHDFNINYEFIGKNIYVGGVGAVDTNDGLTKITPVASMFKAFEISNSLTEDTVVINIMTDKFDKDKGLTNRNFTLLKNTVIKHVDNKEIFFTSADLNLTFTSENGLSKVNKSAVFKILDIKYRDINNMPYEYEKVDTIELCKAKKCSYFVDGSNNVYINTIDGRLADNDVILNRMMVPSIFTINDKKLVTYNCFFAISNPNSDGLQVIGTSNSTLINYNSVFAYAGANGLATKKVGKVYNFNCIAYANGADGFNYHSLLTQATNDLVFEYNCKGYNNGFNGLENNNATTAHEGINILRVGCVGYNCRGPILADVNGCYSLNYNCVMYNSTRSAGSTNTGFWFDSTGANRNHKAWLIDCAGDSEYSLNAEIVGDIYIKSFKGNKIPSGLLNKIQYL